MRPRARETEAENARKVDRMRGNEIMREAGRRGGEQNSVLRFFAPRAKSKK